MDLRQALRVQHARTHSGAVSPTDLPLEDMLFAGLTDDQVRARPHAGVNSIAWLVWHMARTEDVAANVILAGRDQVFAASDWPRRLNVARRDIGTGMTKDEVDDLSAGIDLGELRAYRAAVGRRTQDLLAGAELPDLSGVVDAAHVETAAAAGAFGDNAGWLAGFWASQAKDFFLNFTIIGHNYMQLGEAWVIRGLLGMGGM